MEISTIIPHIEALIFASEKPLPTLDLVELVNNALGFIEDRASLDQAEAALDAIREKYQSEFYPFEVKESGGGWQFLTKPTYHTTVAQLNGEKYLKRLSTAALETLSIIAYKQPVTKGEIENIRGVNCDYAVQKLLEKELIIITGRRENAPGQPLIYATSKSFMDYFGINSVDDLPKLKDVIATETVEATTVTESNMVEEDLPETEHKNFAVNELGDIEEISGEMAEEIVDERAGDIDAELATIAEDVDAASESYVPGDVIDEAADAEIEINAAEEEMISEEDETDSELPEITAEVAVDNAAVTGETVAETNADETKPGDVEAFNEEPAEDDDKQEGDEKKQAKDDGPGESGDNSMN